MTWDESGTAGAAYTERLTRLQGVWWKRLLPVQAPYRWNLRRLLGGRQVVDVGCGIGRNLAHLDAGSVGVDPNEHSVQVCRDRGLTAFTVDGFLASEHARADRFDGLLCWAVLEHLPEGSASSVLATYLPFLAPDARVMLDVPQPAGFAADPTHTVYFDQAALRRLCDELGLVVERQWSFPFPELAGRWFPYNEFVTVARTPNRGDP